MKKNTLEEIGNRLLNADSILLYPHILMDGDTLGSCVALCKALRTAGKTVYILIEDAIPAYLDFLDREYCTNVVNIIERPDISVAVDCSDIGRFVMRHEKFMEGKTSICLDHHLTNNYFADYNYIDDTASATGEIIYDLLRAMNLEIDVEMAEAIYAAITTDTGNFQYTNTTKRTHLITAELFDIGIDLEKISVELYQNIRHEKLMITNEVLNTIEMLCDGKADMAYLTQDMLKKTGASMDETDGVIDALRNIKGVEISAFLKEKDVNDIKVGFRAKTYGDVASIAKAFGGGGHRKAAGCTLKTDLKTAKDQISAAIIQHLKEASQKDIERKNQTKR